MGRGEGSARRRRERRLRAWWRHEQASVSAAVVSALHHSCDVGPVLYEALRGHKKTTEGEVEEQAAHTGLRAQKTPPPGERPGLLLEPGPQRSDRTVRRSSGDNLPTLALSSLAGSAGEEMDVSILSFLTRSILKMREEEKKVQAMREEVRDPDGWNLASGSDGVQFFWHRRTHRSVLVLLPSASRRKRNKKRKKKLPRSGRTRRRHRQWRVRHAGFCWFLCMS